MILIIFIDPIPTLIEVSQGNLFTLVEFNYYTPMQVL